MHLSAPRYLPASTPTSTLDKGITFKMRLGPRELLEYNAKYKVLICRDCHYAIQKNALGSHLLRHKIYREERLRLLSTIHQLDIVEPDDVPLPSPSTLPVDALPAVSGYSCTMAGCGHLCASSKRMRRHWSDAHNASAPNNFASQARSVKLQTFFRGTKLKYFEVSVPSRAAESQGFDEGSGLDRQDSVVNEMPSLVQPMSLSETSPVVDLETLTYFHHFIITTCLTLPKIEDSPPSQYWGTYVISLALQQRWLICGLLAISAYHSATLEGETTAQQKHCEWATKLRSEFFLGFNEIMNNISDTVSTENFQETKKAAIQVRSIMSCARWTLTGFTANYETVLGPATVQSRLQSLLCEVRDFASSQLGDSSDIEQSKGDEIRTSLSTNRPQDTATTPTVLLNRLQMLPYRMAEIFGKPDHEQDAPAVIHGIAALLRCCSSIFESNGLPANDLSRPWQGISAWLNKTTDHFNHMVSLQNPAALILLAHWAAILLKRAEVYECWFIHGFSRAIVLLIHEHLSTDDAGQNLVEGLLE